MKKQVACALAALACTVGITGTARAVPIEISFTGTELGGTGAVSGGFNFETDRLFRDTPPGIPPLAAFTDWQPTDLTAPLASFSGGGYDVVFPSLGGSNYSSIQFIDGCNEAGCPSPDDHFTLFAFNSEAPADLAPDFTGTYSAHTLLFLPLANGLGTEQFDTSTVEPAAITTLPMGQVLGIFSDWRYDCFAGACASTQNAQVTFFMDSVTRTLHEVPEPETLSLFAAAGLAFLLRRRPAVSARPN